ncbi:MAG TPA: hypothetical protein VLV31_00370 [Candidatus Acidoferrales bacterium]|nr:hypothetical protein [Candidatus Acidoferrales bacterium]
MGTSSQAAERYEHQNLIMDLIDRFEDGGLKIVKAAFVGFDAPYKIGRHAPDIIAMNNEGLLVIGEAKCCNELDSQETMERFQDFSNFTATPKEGKSEPAIFHIIVPSSCEVKLGQVLSRLGLTDRMNIVCWTDRQK